MCVGTGLGLFSLAKRVEALGGHYGVRNRPDGVQGSIFWFAIPYKPDHLATKYAMTNSYSTLYLRASASCNTALGSTLPGTLPGMGELHPSHTARLSPPIEVEPLNILLVDDSLPILKMTGMISMHVCTVCIIISSY